jgi:hypothetical protein
LSYLISDTTRVLNGRATLHISTSFMDAHSRDFHLPFSTQTW